MSPEPESASFPVWIKVWTERHESDDGCVDWSVYYDISFEEPDGEAE